MTTTLRNSRAYGSTLAIHGDVRTHNTFGVSAKIGNYCPFGDSYYVRYGNMKVSPFFGNDSTAVQSDSTNIRNFSSVTTGSHFVSSFRGIQTTLGVLRSDQYIFYFDDDNNSFICAKNISTGVEIALGFNITWSTNVVVIGEMKLANFRDDGKIYVIDFELETITELYEVSSIGIEERYILASKFGTSVYLHIFYNSVANESSPYNSIYYYKIYDVTNSQLVYSYSYEFDDGELISDILSSSPIIHERYVINAFTAIIYSGETTYLKGCFFVYDMVLNTMTVDFQPQIEFAEPTDWSYLKGSILYPSFDILSKDYIYRFIYYNVVVNPFLDPEPPITFKYNIIARSFTTFVENTSLSNYWKPGLNGGDTLYLTSQTKLFDLAGNELYTTPSTYTVRSFVYDENEGCVWFYNWLTNEITGRNVAGSAIRTIDLDGEVVMDNDVYLYSLGNVFVLGGEAGSYLIRAGV